jgi:hypothetical protein
MGISGQLHTPGALPPGIKPLVHTVQVANEDAVNRSSIKCTEYM